MQVTGINPPHGGVCCGKWLADGPYPEQERRIDPMLDNRSVTYAEMVEGLRDQGLSEAHLQDHWDNLQVDNHYQGGHQTSPDPEKYVELWGYTGDEHPILLQDDAQTFVHGVDRRDAPVFYSPFTVGSSSECDAKIRCALPDAEVLTAIIKGSGDTVQVCLTNLGGTVLKETIFPSGATVRDLQAVISTDLKPEWIRVTFYSDGGQEISDCSIPSSDQHGPRENITERLRDHDRLSCQGISNVQIFQVCHSNYVKKSPLEFCQFLRPLRPGVQLCLEDIKSRLPLRSGMRIRLTDPRDTEPELEIIINDDNSMTIRIYEGGVACKECLGPFMRDFAIGRDPARGKVRPAPGIGACKVPGVSQAVSRLHALVKLINGMWFFENNRPDEKKRSSTWLLLSCDTDYLLPPGVRDGYVAVSPGQGVDRIQIEIR